MVKMDEGLPIVGPSVDLSQAPAINQKRILAFVNHFVSHTVCFLNKFSASCEQKLADIQMRIQRLEITLNILEAKLASIPGLENITASVANNNPEQVKTENNTTTEETTGDKTNVEANHDTSQTQETNTSDSNTAIVMKVSKDPRYERFFKMASVGVPIPAVKAKMSAEGLNPDLLDDPDAPTPDGGLNNDVDDSDGSSSDASSFSDSD